MTYNVFGGTLNLALSIYLHALSRFCTLKRGVCPKKSPGSLALPPIKPCLGTLPVTLLRAAKVVCHHSLETPFNTQIVGMLMMLFCPVCIARGALDDMQQYRRRFQ